MTPEERSLLERTYKIVEENNLILRGIRRSNRINAAIKIFYWLVIISITFGMFFYLQPYLESMLNMVGQAQQSINSISNIIN